MKTVAAISMSMLLVVAGPVATMADRAHRPVGRVLDTIPALEDNRNAEGDHRRPSGRSTSYSGHHHPARTGDHFRHHPGYDRALTVWPSAPTVVREIQPIIIMAPPSPQAPPPAPEPEKVWVPPVMGTHTEPGYWDYGIRKVWMGDHWRYEQDLDQPVWVPEKQVSVVKQEGHWKVVE